MIESIRFYSIDGLCRAADNQIQYFITLTVDYAPAWTAGSLCKQKSVQLSPEKLTPRVTSVGTKVPYSWNRSK